MAEWPRFGETKPHNISEYSPAPITPNFPGKCLILWIFALRLFANVKHDGTSIGKMRARRNAG